MNKSFIFLIIRFQFRATNTICIKANGYSIYKNAFLKAMPIILPYNEQNFEEMTLEEFDTYIYELVGMTEAEINIVETAQFSQA